MMNAKTSLVAAAVSAAVIFLQYGTYAQDEGGNPPPPPPPSAPGGAEADQPPPPPDQDHEKPEANGEQREHEGEHKGRMSEEGRQGWIFKEIMDKLSEDERKQLMELQKTDPEKFKQVIKEKIQAYKQAREKEEAALNELVKKYKEASTPEQKAELETQIKKILKADLDKRIASGEREIEAAQKRIDELRKKIEERKKNADKIVDDKFKEITKDPDKKW